MGVVIDDIFTEVEGPTGGTGGQEQPRTESAVEEESDLMLLDRINRLEKRQLRLLAD